MLQFGKQQIAQAVGTDQTTVVIGSLRVAVSLTRPSYWRHVFFICFLRSRIPSSHPTYCRVSAMGQPGIQSRGIIV